MRTPALRTALLLTGAASLTVLLTPLTAARAQGLYPGAPAGSSRPTLGGVAQGGSATAFAPIRPYGGGIVSRSPIASPFANPFGGFAARGYSPGYRQPYAGAGWTNRTFNYMGSRPEIGSTGVLPRSAQSSPVNGLPDDHLVLVHPVHPSQRPEGYGTVTSPGSGYPGNEGPYFPPTIVSSGPALLGGYYYGGYCDTYDGVDTYPSVYADYDGFPGYIDNIAPGVAIITPPQPSVYVDNPLPFYPPVYTATYNQNNYYFTNPDQADQIDGDQAPAPSVIKKAYPADSYQAAFADIESAWNNGDISLLKKHLRSNDTKVSVYLQSDYKYSINSSDFAEITRDAFDRLNTVSFKFTALQKAKDGDVTAYGTHVYRPENSSGDGGVVPFDADSAPDAGDTDGGAAADGSDKTVYVSYTLRHGDDGWYITSINSSTEPLVQTAS